MTEDPISYRDGKVSWNDTFKRDEVLRAVLPLLEKNASKANDLGGYLFLMYSPRSIYRSTPEQERRRMVFKGHISDSKWLLGILADKNVQALIERYSRLVMLPAERLRLGLLEAIEKLLQDLSDVDVSVDRTYLKIVEEGKKLHAHAKDIEAMVAEQRGKKVKAGYRPRMFERKG